MFGTDVAVLVADISGSTALYESAGNEVAFNLISTCLDQLRRITEGHSGLFIHSKGDDVMCTFALAQHAFDAATEMLLVTEDTPLSLHAGIDFGPVLRARGDIFGDCVNTTARLAGYATSGEVLCSQTLYEQLDKAGKSQLRFLEKWRFKGKAEGARVYVYSAGGMGQATHYTQANLNPQASEDTGQSQPGDTELHLTFRGETIICTQDQDISIGRSITSDLVVPRPWVSRKHAVIEIRRTHAYLRDVSSNGTFICFAGQPAVLARREAVLLPNNCALSLTKAPDDPEAELITCQITTPSPRHKST